MNQLKLIYCIENSSMFFCVPAVIAANAHVSLTRQTVFQPLNLMIQAWLYTKNINIIKQEKNTDETDWTG